MASTTDELVQGVIEHAEHYVEAFNSGDAAAVDLLYTDDAVSVWEKGKPVGGQERRDGLAAFLAQKPVMKTTILESYVTGDTALLVVDWAIEVTAAPGGPEHHKGIGLDVLRRGGDGKWRFAIDNPHGKDI
ncbi:YybH family protein [Streptomyces sp. 2A115]|uniref:YybH family protein n=1 Tax=Streptomyces sp. 2A115 TaxID=3457439 RepID=UPI003FD1F469